MLVIVEYGRYFHEIPGFHFKKESDLTLWMWSNKCYIVIFVLEFCNLMGFGRIGEVRIRYHYVCFGPSFDCLVSRQRTLILQSARLLVKHYVCFGQSFDV